MHVYVKFGKPCIHIAIFYREATNFLGMEQSDKYFLWWHIFNWELNDNINCSLICSNILKSTFFLLWDWVTWNRQHCYHIVNSDAMHSYDTWSPIKWRPYISTFHIDELVNAEQFKWIYDNLFLFWRYHVFSNQNFVISADMKEIICPALEG
jgi:hypothetical protein